MWVILESTPDRVRFDEAGPDGTAEARGGFLEPGEEGRLAAMDGLSGVAHVLSHGGEAVRLPAQSVDGRLLREILDGTGFLPEESRRILERTVRLVEALPAARHLLLCDTAFFTALPEEAALYAVPHRFSRQGVRRYGGDGLLHEWVWRRTAVLMPGTRRLVSVGLGNRSNLAAIRDGKPMDTTVGFTPVEGLPSDTSSGDVDPTLIFQLSSRGHPMEEILEMLSRRSGFGGYCGRPTGLADLATGRGGTVEEARRIFLHALVKYVGAAISTLDGLDALAFASDCGAGAVELALEACGSLGFLGIRTAGLPVLREGAPALLSAPDSRVPVLFLPARRRQILYEQIQFSVKE